MRKYQRFHQELVSLSKYTSLRTEHFRFVYLHFSADQITKLVSKLKFCFSFIMNLNALIEIKGDNHQEFINFFKQFVLRWRNPKYADSLRLTRQNLAKLVAIPGALELMFSKPFTLTAGDFLSLLNYGRAFYLLKSHESNLRAIAWDTDFQRMVNETILYRA